MREIAGSHLPAAHRGAHFASHMSLRENWVTPTVHDSLRSVELVRFTLALVLLTHPVHALLHPEDAAELARQLSEHGLPASAALAWLGLLAQLLAGVGLLVRRFIAPAALASMLTVGIGSAILYAPRWFVLGGEAEDGKPGVEFSVLILVLLSAVAWTWRERDRATQAAALGFQILALGSALLMLPHGFGPFVQLDFEGMREWGEGMTRLGWPHGLALVWSLKILELVCVVLRLSRRLIVPACLGHLLILVPGMIISQHLAWFVVGPGEGGIEYPVLLSAGAIASLIAYWPRTASAPVPAVL